MMLHEYKFTSCFAKHIEGLIEQKHDSGYIYDSQKYNLIEFDRFCIRQEINEVLITKELSDSWKTWKDHEGKSYRASRMGVLRQLALYMVSLG